jgi:hypothetical protein
MVMACYYMQFSVIMPGISLSAHKVVCMVEREQSFKLQLEKYPLGDQINQPVRWIVFVTDKPADADLL